jgi:hypothetical protein
VVLVGALFLVACATQEAALDPAQIEQEIAASKAEELDLVRATIEEPARADMLIELLAERDQLLERFTRQIAAHKAQMARLNADYRTERSEFEAALADYNKRRTAAQKQFIDLVAEMKRVTTAEEWSEISVFQQDRLNPRKLAYSGLDGGS